MNSSSTRSMFIPFPARKPLFLDESAHSWRLIRLGRELAGRAWRLRLQNATGAILSACWARAHGMSLMVQDLTNRCSPKFSWAAGWHVWDNYGLETNAMQFYRRPPGRSKSASRLVPPRKAKSISRAWDEFGFVIGWQKLTESCRNRQHRWVRLKCCFLRIFGSKAAEKTAAVQNLSELLYRHRRARSVMDCGCLSAAFALRDSVQTFESRSAPRRALTLQQ